MKWKDILKNVITQGRVKEIEDIDIDIEDDNCNRKLQQINESQSTEGAIPVNRVVDMTRGYSQTYIDSLMRGAENRNK